MLVKVIVMWVTVDVKGLVKANLTNKKELSYEKNIMRLI